MGDLERYIVEEWAEDYQDGRLNRREFLRRVALMAGGTAVALPVLRQLGVGATLEEISAATAQAPVVVAQAPSPRARRPPDHLGALFRGGVACRGGRPGVRWVRAAAVVFFLGGGLPGRPPPTPSRLRGAFPFPAPPPPLEDVPKIRAAVL